jgi:predicted secreted protein
MVRKVVFLANCLLNQNAKVAEFALYPGVVGPVVDLFRQKGFEVEQLPCPELTFMGINRWWQTKDQYDTPGYRKHCRRLAKVTAGLIEHYKRSGCKVYLVGLDGSPSSGVRLTGRNPTWGGRPLATLEQYQVVPGRGVWIEELLEELKRRGITFDGETGVPMDVPGFNMDRSLNELRQFIEEGKE